MPDKPATDRAYSRREFLKGVPFAVLGAYLVGAVLGRPVFSRLRRSRPPTFPEGSIFTPSKDAHRDN